MAKRYLRKLALLGKIETVYGTDAVPTGGANAIRAKDVTIDVLAGSEETRDLVLPYLGHQGVILTNNHVKISGKIELTGSGAAGTAPGYAPILRAAGLAQTINAGVSVDYDPVSSGYEAATFYYNLDGVRHVVLGARASVSLDLSPQKIPYLMFAITGLLGTISDQALPALTFSGFQTPIVCSKQNTQFSLHGFSAIAEAISLDLGNSVETRLLVNSESVEIVDRKATGSVTLEADTMAAKDWFAIAAARTRGALSIIHGTVAGNIVEIPAPAVEIGRPNQGNSQGILTYTLPLMLCPVSGNDEIKLKIR